MTTAPDTTTAEVLADIIVELLVAADVAGGNVYGVRAWPTQDSQLPQVQLALPEEEKQSLSRSSGNQFTVVATLPLLITVQDPGEVDEQAAAAARGQLADIARAIERTVIGNPAFVGRLQRIVFVKAHGRVDAKGAEVIGQRVMMFGLEYFQDDDDFWLDPELDDLEGFAVRVDARNVVDRQGVYVDPLFPDAATAAPRTSGPDGRLEGGFDLDLTP